MQKILSSCSKKITYKLCIRAKFRLIKKLTVYKGVLALNPLKKLNSRAIKLYKHTIYLYTSNE